MKVKTMKRVFDTYFNGMKNPMTPIVVAYAKHKNYIIELSRSESGTALDRQAKWTSNGRMSLVKRVGLELFNNEDIVAATILKVDENNNVLEHSGMLIDKPASIDAAITHVVRSLHKI